MRKIIKYISVLILFFVSIVSLCSCDMPLVKERNIAKALIVVLEEYEDFEFIKVECVAYNGTVYKIRYKAENEEKIAYFVSEAISGGLGLFNEMYESERNVPYDGTLYSTYYDMYYFHYFGGKTNIGSMSFNAPFYNDHGISFSSVEIEENTIYLATGSYEERDAYEEVLETICIRLKDDSTCNNDLICFYIDLYQNWESELK